MLKWITIAGAVLLTLYGGYWFVGSSAVERGAITVLDDLKSDGWTVEYDSLSVRGFPSRFDTTVEPVEIASPNGDLAWSAPFLQVFALTYRPGQAIVVFPNSQDIRLGGQPIAITSEGLRASVAVALGRDLAAERATVEAPVLTLESEAGQISGTGLLAALREAEGVPFGYDIFLGFDTLEVPDLGSGLASFDGTVVLSALLDRGLSAAPDIQELRIKDARIELGEAWVAFTGTLSTGDDGFPSGRLNVQAMRPLLLIADLRRVGLLTEEGASVARGIISSAEPNSEGVIAFTLRFEGGFATMGGIPLFEVPRL